jgi:hypothetical protein
LVKAGQSRASQASTAAILVQTPGSDTVINRKAYYARLAAAGVMLAAISATLFWLSTLQSPKATPSPIPINTQIVLPTSTATLIPTYATVLYLPTVIPTAPLKPSSTPTQLFPATQEIQIEGSPSFTQTATMVMKATEAIVNTNTPVPPTPTETITPSPTIPAAPITVGGMVVVAGTEGLGISLRDGPSSEAVRIAILLDGSRSDVIDGPIPEGNLVWWQLRTLDGMEGWAVNRFLQGIDQGETAPQ